MEWDAKDQEYGAMLSAASDRIVEGGFAESSTNPQLGQSMTPGRSHANASLEVSPRIAETPIFRSGITWPASGSPLPPRPSTSAVIGNPGFLDSSFQENEKALEAMQVRAWDRSKFAIAPDPMPSVMDGEQIPAELFLFVSDVLAADVVHPQKDRRKQQKCALQGNGSIHQLLAGPESSGLSQDPATGKWRRCVWPPRLVIEQGSQPATNSASNSQRALPYVLARYDVVVLDVLSRASGGLEL